jgi:TonB family protein
LDEKGRVAAIRVVTPLGYGFDDAAKKAMKQAKFLPGKTSDGKAVPTTITYTYSFVVS